MATTTALVLGLLAGVGCKDDEPCEFYFPATGGSYIDRMCELADVAADCIGDRNLDDLAHDDVTAMVQNCLDLEDVCADDPSVMNGLASAIAWELEAKTNDCIG